MEQTLLVAKVAAECARSIYHRSWRSILQVEVFMAAAAMLLFFELVCGSLRRRSNNALFHLGLWVAYTLLPLLITYTLGLMQSAQAKVIMYPVWALSLLIAGGATSITAYDLDDNRQWKRGLFIILQYDIYFCIILFQLVHPSEIGVAHAALPVLHSIKLLLWHPIAVPVFFLFTTVCIAHTFGAIAGWRANYSYPSKMVADYMKHHAAAARSRSSSSGEYYFDPVSMKGCTYLVSWPAYKVSSTSSGSGSHSRSCSSTAAPSGRSTSSVLRCQSVPEDEGFITVEMIWDRFGSNEDVFTSRGVSISRIKGACLAYALSHLLMRRFFGMDCAEASLPETRNFVLQGLLSERNTDDEYTEAFRVIEVELAFLYDFFYTKYALIFGMEGFFFLMVLVKVICASAIGIILLYKPFAQGFPSSWYGDIVIRPSLISVKITVAIIGIFLTVEALQSILYLGSDWAMVPLACSHIHVIAGRPHGFIPLSIRKRSGFLISRQRLPLFGYWQKKLGQYSVIQGSRFFSSRNEFAFQSSSLTTFIISKAIAYLVRSVGSLLSSRGLHFVQLPDMIKRQIVSSLKSSGNGHLTNGEASLRRNHVHEKFSWTLQNETQTESMLIWHIATDYCRIVLSDEGSSSQISSYREVATQLSCYCAYLMSNVPQLLPGNSVDTKFEFDQAVYQAREVLGTKKRDGAGLRNAAAALTSNQDEGSIFTKGLKLGDELESIEDDCLRWKIVAEFWAETILYIAPSENAKAHMERLAQGGEFLTHIWALLTHAGILSRHRPEPMQHHDANV